MKQISKIALAWDLFNQQATKKHIAGYLDIHRKTVQRWVAGIQEKGSLEAFIDQYLQAKKRPRRKRKVDGLVKVLVWQIREEKKSCCGQKIQYFLKRDYGLDLSVTKIYEILREKYVLRSKWKKNQKRGPIPKANRPREVLQLDSVDFGEIHAFNAIDIFSREVDVILRLSLTSRDGRISFETSMERRFDGHVDLAQTDGGPEYKDEFKQTVLKYADRHRVARAYRKNEQAYIESFNRSLRKECLGWTKYKAKDLSMLTKEVEEYLKYYHYERPHLSLGMRPPLGS